MTAEHGALRLYEMASIRLTQDIGALLAAVESVLPAAAADGLPQAARALTARLRLLMAAATPASGPLPVAKLVEMAGGLPRGIRLDSVAVAADTSFPPSFGQVVLNVLLLAADSLPAGGTVRLAGAAEELFIQIEGPNAAWPAGTALCLVDPIEARRALEDAQALRMAVTSMLAYETGVRLSAIHPPNASRFPAILRLGG